MENDLLETIKAGASPHEIESETLEFKEEESRDPKRSLETLADAVVCLANAEGGTIIFGVANSSRGMAALKGVSNKLTVDSIRSGIFARTKPPLSVPVTVISDEPRIIAITVPKGAVFYSNNSGTATRRIGSDCQPFSPEEQRQASAARGQTDWSATLSEVTIDDVAAEEIVRFRRLLLLAGREELSRADTRKMLRDLRLVDAKGRLTKAGVLMLCTPEVIAVDVPTYGYAYQYRASPGSESSARFRGTRSVLSAVETLLEAVSIRSRVHPLSAGGGVQLQIQDYPNEAIRELVVNGFVHRDYELAGSVEVEHAPDSMVVTSPGGLVFGITPDNILTHPSTTRNRLLLETVTALQVAERTGQGIDRAYRELLRAGKEPPAILDDGHQVRVTVVGGTGNDAFARFAAQLSAELGGDVDVLLALSHLRDARSITAAQLARLAQRSAGEAQGVLERMTHAQLVEPTRRTARRALPTYVLTGTTLAELGRAVRYHYRRIDDTDRKVIDHVREYGHVTNQTLRRLFDIDVPAARDLLRAMQVRGVLEKLDQARGGRGVRYGPGARFDEPRGTRTQGQQLDVGRQLDLFDE